MGASTVPPAVITPLTTASYSRFAEREVFAGPWELRGLDRGERHLLAAPHLVARARRVAVHRHLSRLDPILQPAAGIIGKELHQYLVEPPPRRRLGHGRRPLPILCRACLAHESPIRGKKPV